MSRAIPMVVDDSGTPSHIYDFLPTRFSTTLVDNKDNPLIKPLLQEFAKLNQQLADLLYTTVKSSIAIIDHPEQYLDPKRKEADVTENWADSNHAIFQKQKEIGAKITRSLAVLKEIRDAPVHRAFIERFVQQLKLDAENKVREAWVPTGDFDCALMDSDELNDVLTNLGCEKEVDADDLWEQLDAEQNDIVAFEAMKKWFVEKTAMSELDKLVNLVKESLDGGARGRIDGTVAESVRSSDATKALFEEFVKRRDYEMKVVGEQILGVSVQSQLEVAEAIERSNSIGGGTKNKKRNKKYSKKKSKRSKRSRSRSKQRRSKRSLSKSRSKRSKRSKRR